MRKGLEGKKNQVQHLEVILIGVLTVPHWFSHFQGIFIFLKMRFFLFFWKNVSIPSSMFHNCRLNLLRLLHDFEAM